MTWYLRAQGEEFFLRPGQRISPEWHSDAAARGEPPSGYALQGQCADKGGSLQGRKNDKRAGCQHNPSGALPAFAGFYDACDELGFVVWAEIPFISVMSPDPAAHENCITQLKELVLQNYNHPSICFWGISNEILIGGISEQLVENHKD